jgi:hypothetical protein
MKPTYIAAQRLLLISDGEDEMVLASVGLNPFEVASAFDHSQLHTAEEVPAVTLDPAAVNAALGDEWMWDDVLAAVGRCLRPLPVWTKAGVEQRLAGFLGARAMH